MTLYDFLFNHRVLLVRSKALFIVGVYVNIIQFKGHHSRLPHADAHLLPGDYALWQAWRMPSGNYIIQGLDERSIPQGSTYPIDAATFTQVLTPLLASVGRTTRADAPDLIYEWYTEIASLKGPALYTQPQGEYHFFDMPPLHPDTLAAIALAEEHAQCGYPSDAEGAPATEKAVAEEDIAKEEPAAGKEITPLFDTDTPAPQLCEVAQLLLTHDKEALAEKIHSLINMPAEATDSSYQATLTELGLTLRQNKYYDLAKLCHLRVLELTPNDERVLFNIARTEYKAGNIDSAKDYLTRCLAVAPNFNVAKNFLTFISTDT